MTNDRSLAGWPTAINQRATYKHEKEKHSIYTNRTLTVGADYLRQGQQAVDFYLREKHTEGSEESSQGLAEPPAPHRSPMGANMEQQMTPQTAAYARAQKLQHASDSELRLLCGELTAQEIR